MKGFVYLLEISIALILIIIALGAISSSKVKESWERPDLIGTGDNIIKIIRNEDVNEILNGNVNIIESIKPGNMDYGIKVTGIPKRNISIGCNLGYYDYVKSLLTPVYLNGRWINFTVEQFDISSKKYIPSYYDAVVFVNFTDYTNMKSNFTDYLSKGGVVIGINGTYSNNNADFNEIFGLNATPSYSGNFYFNQYNSKDDEIEKYFYGIDFDVNTSNTIGVNRWGNWNIWEVSRKVNITPTDSVDVENKTTDEGFIQSVYEGGNFSLKGPDNNFYLFKVKKIFWDRNLTILQPMNYSFIFKNISETNDVTGKVRIVAVYNNQTIMASNNKSIWISDFSMSDEYRTLVRAAIMSRVKEWYVKEPDLTKEHVLISLFYPLCCDIPEIAGLTFYLWYKI